MMSANDLTIEGLLRAHAPHAPESLRERVFALESKRRRLTLPPRRLRSSGTSSPGLRRRRMQRRLRSGGAARVEAPESRAATTPFRSR
jgi:hypothetical protein